MLEATRKQEATIHKETLEQLDAFRKHQEEEERKLLEKDNAPITVSAEDAAQWSSVGRKRKKVNEKETGLLRGVKLRKASSGAVDPTAQEKTTPVKTDKDAKDATDIVDDKDVKQSADASPLGHTTPTFTDRKGKQVLGNIGDQTVPTSKGTPVSKPANPLPLSLGYASSDEDE